MSSHTELRNSRLKKFVLTSVFGKFSSVFLQLFSLPVAAVALGNEGFARYSVVTSILAWLALSNLGMGPALAVRISAARGKGDDNLVRQLFSTASLVTFSISAAVALLALVLILNFDVSNQFLGGLEKSEGIENSIFIVVLIFFVTMNVAVVESAQLAFQEGHKLNIYVSMGMVVSAVSVILVSKWYPSVEAIVLAVNGPTLLARLANVLITLTRHPVLRASFQLVRGGLARTLLSEGVRFSAGGGVNNFLCHFFPIIIFAKVSSAVYVASLSAVTNAVILLASFFSMTSAPLLGALPEAKARNDTDWIRRIYVQVLRMNMLYSVVVACGVAFLGVQIFDIWYQGSIKPAQQLLAASGVYFILLALEVTNFTFLSALGFIKISSLLLVFKALLFSGLLYLLADANAGALPFMLGIAVNFAFSAVPLTIICYRSVNQ